jgi:hypothetical protein
MNGTYRTHGGHDSHESYKSHSLGHDNFSRIVDDSRVTDYAAIDGYTINRPP